MGGGGTGKEKFAALVGQNAGDDFGEGGFSAAALAGNGNKFPRAEGQVDAIETHDHRLPGGVVFGYVLQGKKFSSHKWFSLSL